MDFLTQLVVKITFKIALLVRLTKKKFQLIASKQFLELFSVSMVTKNSAIFGSKEYLILMNLFKLKIN